MKNKSNWLEEAKKSRAIMLKKWNSAGQPTGDFYKWLVDQVDAGLTHNRKESARMNKYFRDTIK